MALANKFQALVLTTGNKSEMSVGYCTLYGDMAGALAVIGDLFKTEVYRLCRYVNRLHPVIPRSILDKPPSAELRPGQKDTDSLPPYEVLDPILEAYVEYYRTPEEIAAATVMIQAWFARLLSWWNAANTSASRLHWSLRSAENPLAWDDAFP